MKVTKISNAVLDILAECRMIDNRLQITAQLDRKQYTEVNKILEAAGGKWDKKAKAHLFAGAAIDAIDPIILTGEITKPQDMGQFDTPIDLARKVVQLADLFNNHAILEPSAGIGNMVQAIREVAEGATIFGCEIDPNRHAILKRNFSEKARFMNRDFLTINPMTSPQVDRVVMNPPFAKQADIDHVTHAYQFLKRDGSLTAIMSAGVTFRSNRKAEDFRNRFEMKIEPLPASSFKSSGTEVNTVLVTIPGGQ